MDNRISLILNSLFTFAYPAAFIGAILYSINSFMTVDLFSIALNRTSTVILNLYIGICGYIAFCTFYKIQIVISEYVINFEKIYISYQHYNDDYIVSSGQIEISLTGF